MSEHFSSGAAATIEQEAVGFVSAASPVLPPPLEESPFQPPQGALPAPAERKTFRQWVKLLQTKGLHSLGTPLILVLLSAALALVPLWFSAVDQQEKLFESFFDLPIIAVLNILPVVLLCLFLYFVTNRAWLSWLLTGALALTLAFANIYKLTFRNAPIYFEDITLFREAGEMADRGYDLFLIPGMVSLIAAFLGLLLLLYLFAAGRQKAPVRFLGATLLLCAFFPLSGIYASGEVYDARTRNEALINPWAANEVFYSKGFVYPLLHSAWTGNAPLPDDYDEKLAQRALAAYPNEPIPEEQRIDVMSFMLEAYADFEKYGIDGLSSTIYAPLHRIQEESIYGSLITNIFAGGTVDTERAFLSGFVDLPSYRSPTTAYPWYFRQNGYYTEGGHACFGWFYDRENINYNLGFENYYFIDSPQVGKSPYDRDVFPNLEKLYRDHCAQSDDPYFAYHLTYQGHGPYTTEYAEWGEGFVSPLFPHDTRMILSNYFGSIRESMTEMEKMLGRLKDFERPLVVVVFGDHKPALGEGAVSIYHELGINLALSTPDGYRNYYETPYFIWANDKAKEVLGKDFQGYGGDVAPAFLMNKVFEACGIQGPPFMQAMDVTRAQVPVPTNRDVYFLPDGTVTLEEPAAIRPFESIQAYARENFLYPLEAD